MVGWVGILGGWANRYNGRVGRKSVDREGGLGLAGINETSVID